MKFFHIKLLCTFCFNALVSIKLNHHEIWVPHMIIDYSVSPWPKPSFFFIWGLLFNLGVCWDRELDLDQGLTIKSKG